jgi:glutamine amidotransferase of anthranilate synthase or aminodeoxychorismate synthase
MTESSIDVTGSNWRPGQNRGRGSARVLVIDNYDSFAYNLVQYIGEFASAVNVRRNDAVSVDDIRELDPDGIVVSPGPGVPQDANVTMDVWELDRPILGVCLGHQAMCATHGATVGHAPDVVHGKPSVISHDGTGVFDGVPSQFEVGRYHSLCVEPVDLPDAIVETARTKDANEQSVTMGVRHRQKPHIGVQFHPESILTGDGKRMIRNFVSICDRESTDRTDPV